jgi:polysaccharide deacetylase 2 family uncharacterized protein YibQ
VADDELSAPLGKTAKKKRRRFTIPVRLSHVVAVGLALFLATFVSWALMVDDPLGGEPLAVVATGFDAPKQPPTVVAAAGARSYDGPGGAKQIPVMQPVQGLPEAPPPTPPAPAASGPKTVTIIDGSTGKRQEVAISGTRDIRAPLEQKLFETSRHGPIPRVGNDGSRPSEVYARPLNLPPAKKDSPKIAIVVGGLGISANVTQQAMAKLPGAITFAFPPYGSDVDSLATKARADGHELLLQAPMEPFDYPDNDPGPQTLLTTLPAEQNLDRLNWLMSRFQGYVGIANYMGARFTAAESALAPVLKEVSRRGLIYVDDGASPRSLAGHIAGINTLPFAKADVVMDAVPTAAHLDRALARLEAIARERGVAVGVTQAMPAAIERIAAWAKAVEGRGFVLVPITAVAIRPKSS